MQDEISALRKSETWELVPKLKYIKFITFKCSFKVKWKEDGSIDRIQSKAVLRMPWAKL